MKRFCLNQTPFATARLSLNLLVLLVILLLGANPSFSQPSGQNKSQPAGNPVASSGHQLFYKIITSVQDTYGYDIWQDKAVVIHQPSIPGMPGNKGFVKKKDAEKVASLVISKIHKGMIPPAVSKQEMDSLKIKF